MEVIDDGVSRLLAAFDSTLYLNACIHHLPQPRTPRSNVQMKFMKRFDWTFSRRRPI